MNIFKRIWLYLFPAKAEPEFDFWEGCEDMGESFRQPKINRVDEMNAAVASGAVFHPQDSWERWAYLVALDFANSPHEYLPNFAADAMDEFCEVNGGDWDVVRNKDIPGANKVRWIVGGQTRGSWSYFACESGDLREETVYSLNRRMLARNKQEPIPA